MVIRFLTLILWMWLIFGFSSQDASTSSVQSGGIVEFLSRIFHIEVTENFVRKTAHFILYFVLGILAYNSLGRLKNVKFWVVLAFCVLYAASDELHQTFVSGRAGMIKDVLLDSCGSLLGMLLYLKLPRKEKIKNEV